MAECVWIWHEYEYIWIYSNKQALNMYHTIHGVRSLYKLMSIYRETAIQNPVKDGTLLKIMIAFNYFWKKFHLKSLRGFSIYVGFKYVRVLNIRKFAQIWQGSAYPSRCNYERLLNIPRLWVWQIFAYERVCGTRALS